VRLDDLMFLWCQIWGCALLNLAKVLIQDKGFQQIEGKDLRWDGGVVYLDFGKGSYAEGKNSGPGRN